MSLNRAQVIGNLTRDPEVKNTSTGRAVVNFSVATSRRWKDAAGQTQEQTEFHNIVAFGKLAEICGQYLKKGSKVYVDGRLQTRSWEGEDGVKRYRTEIILDNMIMLDKKGESSGSFSATSTREPVGIDKPAKDDLPTMSEGGVMPAKEVAVEDLPF
jgi:single-strand DNA-binding protein